MDLNEYQRLARRTEKDDYGIPALVYHALALAGEAGEVGNKVKKIWRDNGGGLTDVRRTEICDELGDVLWYVAMVADSAGLDLQLVAQRNIEKLEHRHGITRRESNGT